MANRKRPTPRRDVHLRIEPALVERIAATTAPGRSSNARIVRLIEEGLTSFESQAKTRTMFADYQAAGDLHK